MTRDSQPSRSTPAGDAEHALREQRPLPAHPPDAEDEPASRAPPPPAGAGAPLTVRLRDKLPELLLEAASVVFAVLLALAVDEWRDDRAEQRSAQRARAAIEHELRSNAAELDQVLDRNEAALERLRDSIEAAAGGEAVEVALDYQLAELSSAAWESARLTGATAGLGLDWLIGAARLYEIQRLYGEGQRQLVERLAGMGEAIGAGDPQPVLRGLAGRAESLLGLSRSLRQRYREFLAASAAPQSHRGVSPP